MLATLDVYVSEATWTLAASRGHIPETFYALCHRAPGRRRLSPGGEVAVIGAPDGAAAAGGRSC